VRQREDTGLNIVADHDGFDVFHPVVWHLDAKLAQQALDHQANPIASLDLAGCGGV
jgi:hypothetical protein